MEKTMKRNNFSKLISWLLIFALLFTAVAPAGSAYAAETDGTNVEWYNFRNNQENNGVTDKNTPTSLAETYLKWAVKYGTGWSAAPTPPIIVDGKIYTGVGNVIMELDKETGEVIRQSDPMVANVGYAMNPLIYAEGKIFAQVGNGMIQAVDIKTMTTLWHTEKIGGQTVSPISYVEIDGTGYLYTGTWTGESRDGVFFCVTTDNSKVTDGVKAAEWTFMPSGNQEGVKYDAALKATLEDENSVAKRGFYWAGAYANENYVAVGSDDGTSEGDYSANAVFYTLNPKTGDIIDRIDGIKGDIRTTTVYDNGYLYFSTKGGHLYKVSVDEKGNLGEATYIDLGGMTTASPVVYKNKIYIGVCGQGGQFDADGGHGFAVVDNSTATLSADSLMYKIPIKGYPQASALVSTAHVNEDFDGDGAADGRVYIYFTYNAHPGGIYYTYDTADQTEIAEISQELYVPPADKQQYCISTICTDNEGTMYYKNDSCYLMAVERNEAYLEDIAVTADDASEVLWDKDFNPGTGEYNLVVKGSVKNLTIEAAAVEGADSLYYDDKTVNLEDKIAVSTSIIVKKNGKSREYTLNIRKEGTESALSQLKVNTSNSYSGTGVTLSPEFTYDNLEYNVDVSDLSKSFYNIWPDTADVNAKVTVTAVENVATNSGTALAAGDVIDVTSSNSGHSRYAIYPADKTKTAAVNITVTSEDGTATTTYRVNLVKKYYFASITAENQDYTGNAVETTVTVTNGLDETVDPSEYTVTYENNVEVGQAALTVTGNAGGNYEGCSETVNFNICKKTLGSIQVSDQFYTGKALTPAFSVLSEAGKTVDASQYTLTYENNTEIGTATVTATAVEGGAYEGNITASFAIRKKNIAEVTLKDSQVYAYTGGEIKPLITVKDENGSTVSSTKYTVLYVNNVETGTAQLTVTANEDSLYAGSVTVSYDILQGELSYYTAGTKAYTGDPLVSGIVIKDNNWKTVPKSAYTIEFKDNIDVGTASFVATAKEGSGYFGSVSGTFEIEKARIAEVNVENKYYTGSQVEPEVEVLDNYGNIVPASEYTVTYSDNVEVGLANVTVKANSGSNYRGTLYDHFIIAKAKAVSMEVEDQTYTGKAIKPSVKVTAEDGRVIPEDQYTATYKNNVNVGTATVQITMKNSSVFAGSLNSTFEIKAAAVDTVKADSKVTYTGKAIKPSVKVYSDGKLLDSSCYTVEYKNNTKVGKATVTVKGTGNYAGSVSKIFVIVPKAPSTASAKLYGYDDVQFSWNKATGASGYYVYYKKASASDYTYWGKTTGTSIKKANLSDGVKYTFKVVPYYKSGDTYYKSVKYKTASVYTLEKMDKPKASKSSGKVKISWNNISGETGYQISKSTKKTGTNVVETVKSTTAKSKLLSATKGKTYYYKVRAYKTVTIDGKTKTVYGPWSTVRAYKR